MTTTATGLHPKRDRLLSLVVSDTQDQTRAILMAQAVETTQYGDLGAWQDLQRWLEQGPTKVHIPYAATLADAIPPVAVRLRRDFPNVLALIRAHALLHRATRTVENGVITATIADYGARRDLVFDLVAEAVESVCQRLDPGDGEGRGGPDDDWDRHDGLEGRGSPRPR